MRLVSRSSLDGHVRHAGLAYRLAGTGCLRRLVTVQPVVAVNSATEPVHSKSMRSQ
jgi:hypothetical protein